MGHVSIHKDVMSGAHFKADDQKQTTHVESVEVTEQVAPKMMHQKIQRIQKVQKILKALQTIRLYR